MGSRLQPCSGRVESQGVSTPFREAGAGGRRTCRLLGMAEGRLAAAGSSFGDEGSAKRASEALGGEGPKQEAEGTH